MKRTISDNQNRKLTQFCQDARKLIMAGDFEKCKEMSCETMCEYPDAAQPHNILGIILEKTGEHRLAMNHFRAALALDATYRPASQNLDTYGTFFSYGKCAYDEDDCEPEPAVNYGIEYDEHHIGRVVRRV